MGASPEVFAALAERLTQSRDRQLLDELLDQWFDYACRVTDWDAEQWGLDPDRWMRAERAEMYRRHIARSYVAQRWPWSRPSHT